MEAVEEADVDVEGDVTAIGEAGSGSSDNPSSSLLQDHYLDSTWRPDTDLPWSLDSTISEENKAVIEKMLLEEESKHRCLDAQKWLFGEDLPPPASSAGTAYEPTKYGSRYYLSSKAPSERLWHDLKESDKKCIKSPHKKDGKITVRSPTKSSISLKWTLEEKELFEQGLAKFGRRWTKIAMMISSRNVLQVKSYARQYFKNKTKTDGLQKMEQHQCLSASVLNSSEKEEKGKAVLCAPTHLRGRADPNLNAVKIEKLSDDEEVDITDEMDDQLSYAPQRESGKSELLDTPKSPAEKTSWTEPILDPAVVLTTGYIIKPEQSEIESPESAILCCEKNDCELVKSNHPKCTSWFSNSEHCREPGDLADNSILFHCSDQVEEENQIDAQELKPPDQEVEMDKDIILEEEKQAIPEFFVGRQAKTPERYLKIRNYILDQWEKIKPKYLNKTSVRPGLKNCGDVNCIGRIHTYLELIGAINFGCELAVENIIFLPPLYPRNNPVKEIRLKVCDLVKSIPVHLIQHHYQAIYNRPQSAEKIRPKEGKDTIEAYRLVQRLQSMRTRRRRVRDPWGNWCDARDLEGQTFEHLSAEELAKRREDEKHKPPKTSKGLKHNKSSFDPFQLIPCCSFTDEKTEPFQVTIAPEALLIMDLHAHVSMAEVIGLLGGRYSETDGTVKICAAEPCNSLSTGLQCEMDPVSQTQASETLAARGYSIIGWYHSHPAFDPNPSIRDIDTQAKYQNYFSRGGSMFIGVIISPYNRNNPLPYSQITCLVISDESSSDGSYRLPYKFKVRQMLEEPQWELVLEKTRWIIEKYRLSHSCVPMDKIFHRDSDLTCLQKLLECMRKTLDHVANSFIAEEFLAQIENLFLSNYSNKKWNNTTEENNVCLNDLST